MTEAKPSKPADHENNPKVANILLVDNSLVVLSALKAAFKRVPYEGKIYAVDTVAGALAELKKPEVRFDGIITCGFEGDWVKIADYLKANGLRVPIHLLTMHNNSYGQQASERGVPMFTKGAMPDSELNRLFNFGSELLSNKPDDSQ